MRILQLSRENKDKCILLIFFHFDIIKKNCSITLIRQNMDSFIHTHYLNSSFDFSAVNLILMLKILVVLKIISTTK